MDNSLSLEPSPPHLTMVKQDQSYGCLTAFMVAIVSCCIGAMGCAWIGSFAPGMPGVDTPVVHLGRAVAYSLLLIIPFGLVALFLRQERFALWRGLGLAIAIIGGYGGLVGGLLAFNHSGRVTLLPYWLPSLVSIAYSLALIIIWRRRFVARPAVGPLVFGAALGVLVSLGWLWVGTLGTLVEIGLSIVDGVSTVLIGAVAMRVIFFFDEDMLARRPLWSSILAGTALVGFEIGILAARGYFLQGAYLSVALIPTCLISAFLLTFGQPPDPRRTWWAGFACLFISVAISYSFAEAFEGDYMLIDLAVAWGSAVLVSLAVGGFIVVILLAARRWLSKQVVRPAMPAAVAVAAVLIGGVTYGSIGRPGIQPETFFVVMKDQADTSAALSMTDLAERRMWVYQTLTEQAASSQADLRASLDVRQIRYKPYYLVNGIEVYADRLTRIQIAGRPDVARILDSPHARPLPPFMDTFKLPGDPAMTADLTWGVKLLGADRVWEQYNITGKGIIVGSADTGVDWTHPALRSQYLGSEGQHDYTWYDPWYGRAVPDDSNGHGTHTTGTIVGQNGIGVAPGAKFIACRNLARELGNAPVYLECMQFLFAPFPHGGDPFKQGDPSRGADVVNNSWGCPPPEGCDAVTLSIAVEHLYDAGQLYVVSAGNDGPDCATIWPPANAEYALSVGAIGQDDTITTFSSRGPITADGSGRIKPDFVAPGDDVLSSVPGGGYIAIAGTSMSGPHVTGLVALLWSADPSLKGDIPRTLNIIRKTARYETAPDLCGAAEGGKNNVYGYGWVDALAAVEMALER